MNPGDLTTVDNAKEWLGLTGLAIASITQANPAVVTLQTAPSTPLLSGLAYAIEGATGMTQVNGTWAITVLTPLTFSIPTDSTTSAPYTGGGVVGVTDPMVQRLISAVSAYIQNYLNRIIANATYTQYFDGQAMPTMMLPQYPITAVNGLTIDGNAIAARAPLQPTMTYTTGGGYTYHTNGQLALSGYLFTRGYSNVYVSWDAGYMIANEAQTIPASPPYTLTTLARWSAGNRGATYADGTALTEVASAPAQGQYSVNGSTYTFDAADAGAAVLISYAMVPYDVEQACIETMSDWFRYRSRIGLTSMGIEGQTVSMQNFAMASIPTRAKGVLDQYRKVAPIV